MRKQYCESTKVIFMLSYNGWQFISINVVLYRRLELGIEKACTCFRVSDCENVRLFLSMYYTLRGGVCVCVRVCVRVCVWQQRPGSVLPRCHLSGGSPGQSDRLVSGRRWPALPLLSTSVTRPLCVWHTHTDTHILTHVIDTDTST